jgi:hypothetical protein
MFFDDYVKARSELYIRESWSFCHLLLTERNLFVKTEYFYPNSTNNCWNYFLLRIVYANSIYYQELPLVAL